MVHAEAVAKGRTELRSTAQALTDLALQLFGIVFEEYDVRWAARRGRATSVRDWAPGTDARGRPTE